LYEKSKNRHKIRHYDFLPLGFWSLLSGNAKLVFWGKFVQGKEKWH